jgi:hypothetical protein
MMKTMTILALLSMMLSLSAPAIAMSNRSQESSPGSSVVSTANSLGTNDGLQQAAGDLGAGAANIGKGLVNDAYERGLNQGATDANVKQMANTGAKVFGYGKAVEYAGKAAPHVGWVATTAGHVAEKDYTGAAIQGINGCTRTVAVAKIGTVAGTAGGIWVAGKLGAVAGSAAGPLGTLGGFLIGVGAAYVGGKVWDKTIGAGADAVDQKVKDWQAHSQYAGDPHDGESSGGGGGAGWGADAARDGARDTTTQQVRDNMPRPRPPTGGSGGGDCGRH